MAEDKMKEKKKKHSCTVNPLC